MFFTLEEIEQLVKELDSYGDMFWALSGLFQDSMENGLLKDGLKEPGSMGCAVVLEQLKNLFPDALYALRMPKEEVPLYLNKGAQEKAIAKWRLRIGR